jgi:hypothetical protein
VRKDEGEVRHLYGRIELRSAEAEALPAPRCTETSRWLQSADRWEAAECAVTAECRSFRVQGLRPLVVGGGDLLFCQGQCDRMNTCRTPRSAHTSRREWRYAQALSVMTRSMRVMPCL